MARAAPIQIAVCIALLYQQLEVSDFIGLSAMVLLLPIQALVVSRIEGNAERLMEKKDIRQKAMSEVLQGMRVVKFFAWERAFTAKIEGMRAQEIAVLRNNIGWFVAVSTPTPLTSVRSVAMEFFWGFVPTLVAVVAFSSFTLLGHSLTAPIAFTSLSLFNLMRFPLNGFPMTIASVVEARVSLTRVGSFLCAGEIDPTTVERAVTPGVVAVEVEKATFTVGVRSASARRFVSPPTWTAVRSGG